jgi:hypothetical protein
MNQILPLIQALGIGVVLPGVALWLSSHVRNKFLREALIGVVRRGAGVGYDYLASRSGGMDAETARRNAFAASLQYVETAGPVFIKALGVQSDVVEGMVRGELGHLFAADSAITVADKIQPEAFDAMSAPAIAARAANDPLTPFPSRPAPHP